MKSSRSLASVGLNIISPRVTSDQKRPPNLRLTRPEDLGIQAPNMPLYTPKLASSKKPIEIESGGVHISQSPRIIAQSGKYNEIKERKK